MLKKAKVIFRCIMGGVATQPFVGNESLVDCCVRRYTLRFHRRPGFFNEGQETPAVAASSQNSFRNPPFIDWLSA